MKSFNMKRIGNDDGRRIRELAMSSNQQGNWIAGETTEIVAYNEFSHGVGVPALELWDDGHLLARHVIGPGDTVIYFRDSDGEERS